MDAGQYQGTSRDVQETSSMKPIVVAAWIGHATDTSYCGHLPFDVLPVKARSVPDSSAMYLHRQKWR